MSDAAPPDAIAAMDDEQVIAVAQSASRLGGDALELITAEQSRAGPELEAMAEKAAEILHALIAWMPDRTEDDNQLYGALERWLP